MAREKLERREKDDKILRAPLATAGLPPFFCAFNDNLPTKNATSPIRWLAIGSLGVVFGDIGTSPIYTLRQCIQDHPDPAHIYGAVSLIVWYLLAIVTLKYVYFLLRLDNHGEGGVFALLALAKTNAAKQRWLVYLAHRRSRASLWRRHHHAGHFGSCRRWKAWLRPP